MNETDEVLITQALEGSQQAFTTLYEHHLPRAKKILYKGVLRNYHEGVDEVAHAALTNAFMHLSTFKGDCAFTTWLHRIIVNTGLEALRRRKATALGVGHAQSLEYEDDDGEPSTIDVVDARPGPEEVLLKNEHAATAHAIIKSLPERKAELLRLHYLEERSFEEITKIRGGRSRVTTKCVVHRIIRDLRRKVMEGRTLQEAVEENTSVIDSSTSPTNTILVTARPCVQCEKVDRFRYADKLVDDKPMCHWCALRPDNRPEPNHTTDSNGNRVWKKLCACCEEPFTAYTAASKYAPGHLGKSNKEGVRVKKEEVRVKQATITHQPSTPIPSIQPTHAFIRVTPAVLDQMWSALSLEDKARAFELLLGTPATQEGV